MTDSFGEYFLVLQADGLYVIFSSGLKVWVLLLVQDSFHFLYPEFGARFAPICSRRPLFQNRFSYSLFPLTEEGCYFCFGILANHLASIFFLPLSGDSLGLLYVPVPHSLPVTEYKHLLVSILTWICYLRNWPRFLFQRSVLGLLIQIRRNSSNLLFLFSQWETTWQNHLTL